MLENITQKSSLTLQKKERLDMFYSDPLLIKEL